MPGGKAGRHRVSSGPINTRCPRDVAPSGGVAHGGTRSMNNAKPTPRRIRVESGIYERPDGRLEIGWRDARGKLHWRVVDGKLKAARAALATEHAKRARGEDYATNPRLGFTEASEAWWDAHHWRIRPATRNRLRRWPQTLAQALRPAAPLSDHCRRGRGLHCSEAG